MGYDDRAADQAAEVRREADEIATEYEDSSLDALADELDRKADAYDGGPESAAAVASELRRRAAAGVRVWPGPMRSPEDDVRAR
jgi:hypothetical protein